MARFNTLACIHRGNARCPLDVYRFLTRELGSTRLQFIPVVEPVAFRTTAPPEAVGAGVQDWSVTPEDGGFCLCKVFDDWFQRDVGKIGVYYFESALKQYLGGVADFCALALEHNGDLYSCDHFVYPGRRLGNILETLLAGMCLSPTQEVFGYLKNSSLPGKWRVPEEPDRPNRRGRTRLESSFFSPAGRHFFPPQACARYPCIPHVRQRDREIDKKNPQKKMARSFVCKKDSQTGSSKHARKGDILMRHARLKPDYQDTWHHCYNRAVGYRDDRPFADAEKEVFVRLLKRMAQLYTVRIISYTFMSNHYHIILQAPCHAPSEEETAVRYAVFHEGKRELLPGTAACRLWRDRLRDLSWFMRHFQHLCSAWYNRTRPQRRRGPLWAGRFKNTVLQSGEAVWTCWAYVESNPVRAGMVADPADYRFCTYGEWAQTGRHPFAAALKEYLAPTLPDADRMQSATDVLNKLKTSLASANVHAALPPAMEPRRQCSEFLLATRRRVRHWVDGLVIGSEVFVREIIRRNRPALVNPSHQISRSQSATEALASICCWRRLRPALE